MEHDQSMQLKTYSDFKRQLAGFSAGTVISTDTFSPQTMASNTNFSNKLCGNKRTFLFEGSNGANDNSSHIISNSLSSSDHSRRKRMKSSDRLSPLSLPRNDAENTANANSCNSSVISSSNSSINTHTTNNGDAANQANNNVPFAANSWWKKGNNEQLRDMMSTSLASANGLPSNMNNSSDNSYASNSRNGINNNLRKMNANDNLVRPSGVNPVSPAIPANNNNNNTEPRMLQNGQTPASSLKLLGEVAASGGNQNRSMQNPQLQMLQQQMLHQQKQQELQALRLQQGNNGSNISGNNNPFLMGTSPMRSPLNNNRMSRMAMQSRLPQRNMLDPSKFLSDGMNMTQLQLQQQQQQLLQQQQFHLQQQSLFPLAFTQANGPMFSAQASFLQQRQNQAQRQQIQIPAAARGELKIDGMRANGDMGLGPLPAMNGELEESYQQGTSFGHGNGTNGNANGVQKSNSEGHKRKDIEIIDINDIEFSDIVPMMPTSGNNQSLKVDGFNEDVDIDVGIDMDSIGVGNNSSSRKMAQYRSSTPPKNQSKPSSSPKQNPRLKEVKFRAYQAENWTEKFEELLRFREENGHCLVPNCHPENPALAQWTKRQRYQYKLKQDGKRSTITDERVRALDEAGFVWDSHKAVWAERLEELKEFKKRYKHCNVPSRYKPNHQLAIWVKRQRRQWKNKVDRLPNCMTDERQRALEAIGFVWDMKKGKRTPQGSPMKQITTQI